jgi:hypothetical protein
VHAGVGHCCNGDLHVERIRGRPGATAAAALSILGGPGRPFQRRGRSVDGLWTSIVCCRSSVAFQETWPCTHSRPRRRRLAASGRPMASGFSRFVSSKSFSVRQDAARAVLLYACSDLRCAVYSLIVGGQSEPRPAARVCLPQAPRFTIHPSLFTLRRSGTRCPLSV